MQDQIVPQAILMTDENVPDQARDKEHRQAGEEEPHPDRCHRFGDVMPGFVGKEAAGTGVVGRTGNRIRGHHWHSTPGRGRGRRN